jgi:cytochrome c oxidase subunit II
VTARLVGGTDGGLAPPLTEQADDIDRVWNVFIYLAYGVGLFVGVLLLYVVIRYRRRSSALPAQVRYNIPVEILYLVVPLLIIGGLFALTFVSVRAVDESDDEADLVVEVTGFQWQWRFDYPHSGVSITGSDTVLPELVLPASSTVRFELTSIDVIHSFWIPGFRFKRDMFPGETTSFQVDVDDGTGFYENTGVCSEFCGLDHSTMRFSVRIVTPDEFEQWIAEMEDGRR